MHEFLHTNPIVHGIYHSLVILPLLYLAYVLMEFIEHRAGHKFKDALQEDRRTGPIIGATVGMLPLCGFSDLASGLYAGRVISVGTLIALFMSTSGEALLLVSGYPDKLLSFVVLALIKFVIAGICGFTIDLCLRSKQADIHIHDLCEEDHCHCEHSNIWVSALKHTLPIFLFVLSFNLLISLFEIFGIIEAFKVLVATGPYLGIIFSAIIGLVPGCAPLVLLLSLFGQGIISSTAMLAGLFTSTGTGLIVLYKTNKSWKQNLFITLFIFSASLITAGFFEITGLFTILGI